MKTIFTLWKILILGLPSWRCIQDSSCYRRHISWNYLLWLEDDLWGFEIWNFCEFIEKWNFFDEVHFVCFYFVENWASFHSRARKRARFINTNSFSVSWHFQNKLSFEHAWMMRGVSGEIEKKIFYLWFEIWEIFFWINSEWPIERSEYLSVISEANNATIWPQTFY